ncbi:MAG: V-type ATP synthase subunit B [Nitrososphaerota archaeon]|nr:V-type ATP synthase subunit B [Candidatus Calditenuaceae archaeon]MDW8072846.1 V-type ATP synthase subunit B [Nitrososphaerota archaeon]
MKRSRGGSGIEYTTIREIRGPLVIVDRVAGVAYDELVEVETPDNEVRLGRVLEVGEGRAVVQVFEGTSGLSIEGVKARFLGETMKLGVSEELLGRVFDGLGRPIDGLPQPPAEEYRDVGGEPINPERREYPSDFIQTGVSAIDVMNSLVRGQKLPVFSGPGLTHNMLAAQIARQATVPGKEEEFAVIFAALGVQNDEARFFRRSLEESGAMSRSALFLNLADDPAVERIITPRVALTLAEFLAFERDYNVLVIVTDMTNYCEALREISAAREEVPGRKGYPGYMYSDLASIYERAGRIKGRKGTITQMPILTMPSDDITHPIPDLTGYITEGQIVLSRDLHRKGIYPPINVLMSLSRLMGPGVIAPKRTRPDHGDVSNQLYASYSRAVQLRSLAEIVGRSSLSAQDIRLIEFGDLFETRFLKQGLDENRALEESLKIAWDILSTLPEDSLTKIKPEFIKQYYGKAE